MSRNKNASSPIKPSKCLNIFQYRNIPIYVTVKVVTKKELDLVKKQLAEMNAILKNNPNFEELKEIKLEQFTLSMDRYKEYMTSNISKKKRDKKWD